MDFTLVLIDAAGDRTADGDFVYVHEITAEMLADPKTAEGLLADLRRTMAEVEGRPS